MSHSVNTDIVPFVMKECFRQDSYTCLEELPEATQMILCPEGYKDAEFCDDPKPVVQNGWAWRPFDAKRDKIGEDGNLYGEYWAKDSFEVWLINEDQYSNVGEYTVSVIAKDEESLKAFAKDFKIKRPIQKNKIVHWWT